MSKKFIRLLRLWGGVLLPLVLAVCRIQHKKKVSNLQQRWGQRFEKPCVMIIPSHNNTKDCEHNLLSILGQEHTNFRVIDTDDASTDGTWDKVRVLIDEVLYLHNRLHPFDHLLETRLYLQNEVIR